MSWMPAQEPVLGDKRTCDALDLIIVPRVRDLGGGFSVHRALPHAKRQMVGPFIFFDQIGPVQLIAGRGMDVRPHPHIGLATVTYLFDGRVVHRDSQGNALEITPGAMNLMTAGRGIAHSERSPLSARQGREVSSEFKAGSRFHRHKRKPTRLFSISKPHASRPSKTTVYGPG
jgi:redox-sensitive bicupin YhaK (pirin superfamily)